MGTGEPQQRAPPQRGRKRPPAALAGESAPALKSRAFLGL